MDAAYLLGGVTDLTAVGQTRYAAYLAAGIFGAERIEDAYARVAAVLVGPQGWGYSDGAVVLDTLRHVLSLLFLLNRSPYLEDLSSDLLRYAAERVNLATRQRLPKVAHVLQHLGIIDRPADVPARLVSLIDTAGIATEWVAWCEAWRARDTRLSPRRRRTVFGQMLCVGRWLADAHPDIVSPEQWDEDLALEYVSYICTARIGDHLTADAAAQLRRRDLAGRQLSPRSIEAKLGYVRRFFTDLQDRPHRVGDHPARTIAIRFRPERTLDTPAHIQRLIQPDPRDIDPQVWYKLTYAAATLTDEDLRETIVHYPLSFHRAVALLWVTAARRLNELRRLRVGCVRRTWEPGMVAEDGTAIAQEEHLSYLHIPSNKTRGPFWVWIPEYTADAIEAWERERPVGQPKRVDPKDGSLVDFLFCSRNMTMSDRFLNGSLIPLLCAKGGVPERDARGAITSHRGRSTIATMLRRRGISLDDIADYLGHANSNTVRSYARTDPVQFARTIKRANELDRLVDVLVDPRAAAAAKPHVFYFLGRGADGTPRYCGNPAWVACPHRLACLKCSMYVGASEAEVLEARDWVVRFQATVPMTPEEKAATDGDIERLHEIVAAKGDIPAPVPPNPDYIFNRGGLTGDAPAGARSDGSDALTSLGLKLAGLTRDLTAAEREKGGRAIVIRSLKRQIVAMTEQMAAIERQGGDV